MATTKSTKPSAKPTTNKLSVAGTGGLSRRKRIALVTMLVGVLGVGSFWGYDQYQTNQLQAKAATRHYWYKPTVPYSATKGGVAYCKSAFDSANGSFWQISMVVSNKSTFEQMFGEVEVIRGSKIVNRLLLKSLKNQTKYGSTYVSRQSNDTVKVGFSESNNGGPYRGEFGAIAIKDIWGC